MCLGSSVIEVGASARHALTCSYHNSSVIIVDLRGRHFAPSVGKIFAAV